MAKNDVVVRTAADLERKYNFASLLGLKKNVEITAQGIQKIENELNNMLNALVINLKDVLDSQGEISLWFYSGIPTTENEPYISWDNPNDHIGDIYYDQLSGTVYQWNGVWEVNTSPDLIEAMAITNAETDAATDHERKVFFDTPTIPYSNGDWWVKEDGSLFICQISKTSGTYEEVDFIDSSNYTESIAEKIGEEIKVLKGTITIISENYAKFTDLATGGSTTISGDNITTGNIQSNNYIKDVSGMKIALVDGAIDTKNLKIDGEGNLSITDGEITLYSDSLKEGTSSLTIKDKSDNLKTCQYYGDGFWIDNLDASAILTLGTPTTGYDTSFVLSSGHSFIDASVGYNLSPIIALRATDPNGGKVSPTGTSITNMDITLFHDDDDGYTESRLEPYQITTPKIKANNLASGRVTIPTTANTNVSKTIYFDKAFPEVPNVTLTPVTAYPNNNWKVSVGNITTEKFDLFAYDTANSSVTVCWNAMSN